MPPITSAHGLQAASLRVSRPMGPNPNCAILSFIFVSFLAGNSIMEHLTIINLKNGRAMWLACLGVCFALVQASGREAIHGMVASGHPLATEAGVQVLRSGGNAVDAAVAVAFTLGVVDGDNAGIGGGCFILIRQANGSFVAIDGRETAPARATREMFVRNGQGDTGLSQTGPLASGVPGALAAYEYAMEHYGKKKLSDLILPAAEIAERGFKVDASYAFRIKAVASEIAR